MKLRHAVLVIVLLFSATLGSTVEAGAEAATPSVDGFLLYLAEGTAATQSIAISGAQVTYTTNHCTIVQYCSGAPPVECTGDTASCHSIWDPCSPTTCPFQDPRTPGVSCTKSGVTIVKKCPPCVDVCYGCGAPCQSYDDCEAVCTCGAVDCEDNQCHCGF